MIDNVNKKSDQVFESIHAIMHLFRAEQYRAFRDGPFELTHMEGRLLGFLARNHGATLSDLVDYMERDKGQLARLVKSLKEHGLVEGKADQKDQRSVRLHLTDEGLSIHQHLRRQVDRLSGLAVKDLNASEQKQLVTLLQQVRSNLESVADKTH